MEISVDIRVFWIVALSVASGALLIAVLVLHEKLFWCRIQRDAASQSLEQYKKLLAESVGGKRRIVGGIIKVLKDEGELKDEG